MLRVLEHQCQNRSLRYRKNRTHFGPASRKAGRVDFVCQYFISWNCDVATPQMVKFIQILSNSGFELVRCQKIPIRNICEGSYSILCWFASCKAKASCVRVWGNVYSMKVYVVFRFMTFCLAKEIDPHSHIVPVCWITIVVYLELMNIRWRSVGSTIDEYSMNKCFSTVVASGSNGIMQS